MEHHKKHNQHSQATHKATQVRGSLRNKHKRNQGTSKHNQPTTRFGPAQRTFFFLCIKGMTRSRDN